MDPYHFINELYGWLQRKIRRHSVSYSDIQYYWKTSVPILFSLTRIDDQYQFHFDEYRIKKVLIDPFVHMLCDGNRAISSDVLAYLRGPSVLCQAILKPQEPAFTCTDCAFDLSVNMCAACFLETDHRHHTYEISLRRTRGYCQCGHADAWSRSPTCDKHGCNAFDTDSLDALSEELSPNADELFLWITKYAIQILKMEDDSPLPIDLFGVCSPEDEAEHCIVILGDVVNSSLTDVLRTTMNINQSQVSAISRTIRRYGRVVIRRGPSENCVYLKFILQSLLTPEYKVMILRSRVLSHQIYAMRILDWIQNVITRIIGLRHVYAGVLLNHSENGMILVEHFIINDLKFSRETRSIIHLLIRATIYTSNLSKVQFGTLLIKHYENLVKNFTRSDRDYTVSITQLSTDVFALPDLARYFILSCGALVPLLNTLLSEWSYQRNEAGILTISTRKTKNIIRQKYVVNDLSLLLKCRVFDWSIRYQEQVLHCIPALVNLLGLMQRNEMARRITGARENDSDWEPSFWMQMRLTTVIKFAIDWCSADRIVFIHAYRSALLRLLQDSRYNPSWLVLEAAGYRARVLRYHSIFDQVSLSLPLSRFLTGLYLLFGKFGLKFSSPELTTGDQHVPERMLEPVLRLWAVVGQSAAGLWLYNSDTFRARLSMYHDVLCRAEMLDKDLALLQICASIMPPNGFLINIIYKFDLMNWVTEPMENEEPNLHNDLIRHRIRLVEELLDFLITLTGGRYNPKVAYITERDCIKKEIAQQLSIRPMTPAQLKAALSNNGELDSKVERIVREVANYRREIMGKSPAAYELKSAFMDSFNLFHHHYMRHQISEAEENQLMLRRRAGMPLFCPPPPLPVFKNKFKRVAALLHCDTMLLLLRRVLLRCSQMTAQVHSLSQLQKALHLIGYALHDEERLRPGNGSFTRKAEDIGLGRILVNLRTFERAAPHKELINWTVEKYRSLAGEDSDIAVAISNVTEPVVNNDDQRRASRKRRHEQIMAQMREKQRRFLAANADAFATVEAVDNSTSDPQPGSSTAPEPTPPRMYSCILCQEEQTLEGQRHPLVMPTYIQLSMVLLRGPHAPYGAFPPALPTPHIPWLPAALAPTPHVSSCGHVMHAKCLQAYVAQENAPQPFRGPRVNRCPMCTVVFNASMPLLPPLGTPQSPFTMRCTMDLDTWIQGLCIMVHTQEDLTSTPSAPRRHLVSRSQSSSHGPNIQAVSNLNTHMLGPVIGANPAAPTNIQGLQQTPVVTHGPNTGQVSLHSTAPQVSNVPVAAQMMQQSSTTEASNFTLNSQGSQTTNASTTHQHPHNVHAALPHSGPQHAASSHQASASSHATLTHQAPHTSNNTLTQQASQIPHTALAQQAPHSSHNVLAQQAPHITHTALGHQAPHISHTSLTHNTPHSSHEPLTHHTPQISHNSLTHNTPHISNSQLTQQTQHISHTALTHQTPHVPHTASNHQIPHISHTALTPQTPHISHIVVNQQTPHTSNAGLTQQSPHSFHTTLTSQNPQSSHAALTQQQPHISHTALIPQTPQSSNTHVLPHISQAALTHQTPHISQTAISQQTPHTSNAVLTQQSPHSSNTVSIPQMPHIFHTAHLTPHISHSSLTHHIPHASNAVMTEQVPHSSNSTFSNQSPHSSHTAMTQQAPHTSNATVTQPAPHASNAAMTQQAPLVSNAALTQLASHTSNAAMTQQAPHASNTNLTPQAPHASNVAVTQQVPHASNAAVTQQAPHTSNATVTQPAPHASNAALTQQAPLVSNAALTQLASHTSNAAMTQQAPHASNTNLTQQAPHASNVAVTQQAPHASNAALTQLASHTSNAAMTQQALHASNGDLTQQAPHASNTTMSQQAPQTSNTTVTQQALHFSNAVLTQQAPHASNATMIQQAPQTSNAAHTQQAPHASNSATTQQAPHASNAATTQQASLASHHNPQSIQQHIQISEEVRNFLNSMGLATNIIPSTLHFNARVDHYTRRHSLRQISQIMGQDGREFERVFIGVGARSVNAYITASVQTLVRNFTQSINTAGRGETEYAVLTAWKSAAYTIHALEHSLRNDSHPLIGHLSTFQQEYFEFFTQLSGVLGNVMLHPLVLARYAYELIAMVLESPYPGPCLFDWDTFGTVVSLSFALPNLFGSQSTSRIPTGVDRNIIHILLCAQIVKSVLSYKCYEHDDHDDNNEDRGSRHSRDSEKDYNSNPSFPPLLQIMQIAYDSAELPIIYDNRIVTHVRESCVPFLRCCSLFYHFITKESAPQELTREGGDTFENLCKFLHLPTTIEDILKSNFVPKLIRLWLNHPKIKFILDNPSQDDLLRESQEIRQFRDLPFEYSSLLSLPGLFHCENNEQEYARNLLICLICSEKLCSSSSCCQKVLNGVRVGACVYHAYKCGAGVGMFLRIRESDVILLAAPHRGCALTGPYVDKNGETDDNLRRGKPLMLCPVRMKSLYSIWLNHQIHDTISRLSDRETQTLIWQNL